MIVAGTTAGIKVCVAAEVGVQCSLPLIGVPPASSSLPSWRFWQGLQQVEDWAIELAGWELLIETLKHS